ncbi:uncharacterized protein LOC127660594 [Xyrauchen texanus]|uniref:uncharacterized protein LOC127660594 n=1 Tax=Xyrauchen texanus TaxID=154827 RepID=UPI002242799D|nr:uncharacterized protein LOC127660594 [Xyrauchen texanus]
MAGHRSWTCQGSPQLQQTSQTSYLLQRIHQSVGESGEGWGTTDMPPYFPQPAGLPHPAMPVDGNGPTPLFLLGCKAAKHSVNNSSHGWPIPGLPWVTGKEYLAGLGLFPVSTSHISSLERDTEEMDEPPDDHSLGHFQELEARRLKHQWGENGHDRKLQRYRTQRVLGTHLHRDTHEPEYYSSSERLSHLAAAERPCPHKSLISQVPLRLQIKVNGQRGGLGICIAGGKGSLPYKENEEVGLIRMYCQSV